MIKRLQILTLLLALATITWGQQTGDVTHAIMVGVGSSHQLDTYLSPMEYSGARLSFLRETQRITHLASGKVSFQTLLQGAYSGTDNPAGNANEMGGALYYDAGWHYNWTPLPHLRLLAGGLIGADAGMLYNDRNGNNPVQARVNADISASLAGIYSFHIRHRDLNVRYQADLPLMGCMFSPQFGQSYYELSIGSRDHNAVFTHPGNALSLRQMLTLDMAFRSYSLRLGYLSDIHQSHVNNIKSHDISRSFVIGFVRHFSILKHADIDKHNFIL